jgi:hypothetical protein
MERTSATTVIISGLPQLLARLDVKKRQDEENCGEDQHPKILHCGAPCSGVEFQVCCLAGLDSNAKMSVAQAQFDYQKGFLSNP